MLKTHMIAALAASSALAGMALPASAQEKRDSAPYYQSGPWKVLDRSRMFCAIENEDSAEGRLTLSKAATNPAFFSFYADDRKEYRTPSTGIVWRFDNQAVAGRILAGHIYQISDPSDEVEALFSKALKLTITHNDETVAEIDLKGSAAAFRKLEQCSAQYPGSSVPMIPPPAPPFYRSPPPPPVSVPEPDLEGPFEPNQPIRPLDPGLWVRTGDYRGSFLRQEIEGKVGIRLLVSDEGRVTRCMITASSGYAELDSYTCDLVTRRARFQPPTDDKAQRTTGSYSTSVTWSMQN